MVHTLIYLMIYLGSALMVYNVVSYIRYAQSIRKRGEWAKRLRLLHAPIILLVLFLFGYLAVGIFGKPDLIVSGILFGGSIFVFIMLLVMRRITESIVKNEQLETQLKASEESNRAKSSFLSNMSHEIRTPMSAIIGMVNIALKDSDLMPRTREQFERINGSAKHMLGLINDILDMTRIESGGMSLKEEDFSLSGLLDQISIVADGECQQKKLAYDCLILGKVESFYVGDEMKLRQVLLNLLNNAVKFTPAPGSVRLTVEQTASFGELRTLRFIVTDTGIGMDPEFLPKLFEPFSQEDATTTNRYGGSGLGMAITKNIVDLMNGEIQAQSEKNVGSVFTVSVTLHASHHTDEQPRGNVLPAGLRVLVVDDEPIACEHAALVLGEIGVEAEACNDSAQALALLKDRLAEGRPYHVLMTDLRMPGMDGVALTRELRQLDGGRTGVILLTGYSWDDIAKEVWLAGIDCAISKPLFPENLLRELLNLLHKKSDLFPVPVEEPAPPPRPSLEGLRVLLAEDVPVNAEILMDLLDMEGISTEHAENGQIAVDMFEASPEGSFDAILMDVRMPVLDGLGAARAIRALDRPDAKTVPIIALTANAFAEDVQRSLQAGMNAHLSKPVDMDVLCATLSELLVKK